MGQLASLLLEQGPPSIRTENAELSAYVYVDLGDRDIGSYVADAKAAVDKQVKLEPGYHLSWSGQFEYMERAKARLAIVVPFTLLIIFLLLYLNFRNLTDSLICAALGAVCTGGRDLADVVAELRLVGRCGGWFYRTGRVAAETGVIMLIYLEHAWKEKQSKLTGEIPKITDLYAAIVVGLLSGCGRK